MADSSQDQADREDANERRRAAGRLETIVLGAHNGRSVED
jgi:hypothetical protein